MYRLTEDEKKDLISAIDRTFPPEDHPTTPRGALKEWWSQVQGPLSDALLEVDRDQMRSASEAHRLWVR